MARRNEELPVARRSGRAKAAHKRWILVAASALGAAIAGPLAGCPRPAVSAPPSSLLAYVTQFNTNEIAVIDSVLKTPAANPIKVGAGPIRMALKPTGSQDYLYVLNQTGSTVSFVNRRSGAQEEEVAAGSKPDDIAISPDGKFLFVTSPEAGTLTRIKVTDRFADQTISLGAGFRPRGVAVNPVCTKDSSGACTAVTVYVVNETVTTSGTGQTKIGQVAVLTSQSSGMVVGPTVQLSGAEKPFRAVCDPQGTSLFVTDTQLANGLWRIDTKANTGVQFGTAPVGLTHEAVVATDGTVYCTVPSRNQYAQVKPEGGVLLFPDASKIRDTQPEPIAFNSDQSELWIGFVGTSTIQYAAISAGRPLELRSVAYSLSSQSKQPPRDIELAGGI